MKQKIITFIKKETVLVVAIVLAIVSAFIVPPSAEYLSYIDWRTLGLLLSLMIIMEALSRKGLFESVGNWLLHKTKKVGQLTAVLVFLCFVFSMLITNDVALITFVPFTILVLEHCNHRNLMVPVIVLQTIAANMGSMLTPVGNPQNLYLYGISGMSLGEFVLLMLPYTLVSGVFLCIALFFLPGKKDGISLKEQEKKYSFPKTIWLYVILFVITLLVVIRLLPWQLALGLCVLAVLVDDRQVLRKVDYSLLLTFIAFFIFTHNIGSISQVQNWLQQIVEGREVLVSVLLSQLISNVPAALLLTGFTQDYQSLVVGVDMGGLGTLIASMASLISYKIYANYAPNQKGKYLGTFSGYSILFLIGLGVLKILLP